MLIKAEFALDNGPGDIATGATALNARTPASINRTVTLAGNTTALNMLMNGVVVYGVGEEVVTVPWALMTPQGSFEKGLGVEKASGCADKHASIISRRKAFDSNLLVKRLPRLCFPNIHNNPSLQLCTLDIAISNDREGEV